MNDQNKQAEELYQCSFTESGEHSPSQMGDCIYCGNKGRPHAMRPKSENQQAELPIPERTTPPIEKYGRWGLMRCSAEIGTLMRIDVVRMIDELIAAEAALAAVNHRAEEAEKKGFNEAKEAAASFTRSKYFDRKWDVLDIARGISELKPTQPE